MIGKIIVTGGMGYIGSHTVIELLENNFTPVIFDNLSNSSIDVLDGIEKISGVKVAFEKVDITDLKATQASFSRHSDAIGIIHFAALKAVGESVEKPFQYYKNNVSGLINVIESMTHCSITNFIFSSSCTVYGQPDQLPVTENSPILPAASPYGNTKQIGEEILKDITSNKTSEKAVIALRYFNPIGAHATGLIGELPLGVPNNLLPYITQTAIGLREELKVFGNDYNTKDGTAIRDYIHVVDLAQAHVVAVKRLIENKNKASFEAFNIGTGNGSTVLEVIQSFEKSTGVKVNYKLTDRRAGDIESIYADTSFAKNELGWSTQLSLDDMTKSAWKWEQNIRREI